MIDLPRSIPLRTRLRIHFVFLMWFGIVLTAFGLLPLSAWIMSTLANQQFDASPTVAGSASEFIYPGNWKRRRGDYRYDYSYEVDGRAYTGTSWTPAQIGPGEVTVQYLANDPADSRIKGMDQGNGAVMFIFVACFGAPGLAMMIYSAAATRKTARRARHGVVTTATVVRTEQAGGGFTLPLQFTAGDGRIVNLPRPPAMAEGQSIVMFYEPSLPTCAVPLDEVEPQVRSLLT